MAPASRIVHNRRQQPVERFAGRAEERAVHAEPGRGDGRRDHAEGYETEGDVLTRVYQDLTVQPETRA
jgi:hypothetical protein